MVHNCLQLRFPGNLTPSSGLYEHTHIYTETNIIHISKNENTDKMVAWHVEDTVTVPIKRHQPGGLGQVSPEGGVCFDSGSRRWNVL